MALQAATYEEAKASFKPLRRGQIRSASPKQGSDRKLSPAGRIPRKRPLKKKAKRVKTSTLKKKAWDQFSIFIRTRGADETGLNQCVTCGLKFPWKALQAGHFIRGRLNANLFDERGCHAQCHRCNIHFQGNVVLYYKWMLTRFGQEVIDDLILQNSKTRKWQPGELQAIFEKYKELNEANPLCQE